MQYLARPWMLRVSHMGTIACGITSAFEWDAHAYAISTSEEEQPYRCQQTGLSPGCRPELSVRSYPDTRRRKLLRLLPKRIGYRTVAL